MSLGIFIKILILILMLAVCNACYFEVKREKLFHSMDDSVVEDLEIEEPQVEKRKSCRNKNI